jgi:4-hydroxy-tetrahydrodipicolinate reductase
MRDVPRLAIIGYGKMGRAVEALARERGWTISAIVDRPDGASAGVPAPVFAGADVAIEFTEPDAAAGNVRAAIAAGCPIVVGTTGWYDQLDALRQDVERAGGAMLWAPNFSIGVQIFLQVAQEAARRIARAGGFDAHIVETHHAGKRDAPSGTAQALERAAANGLGRAVPITSVRTGSVPGTHDLLFDAPFEQILLRHSARDRRVFADGALRAAQWLVGRRGVFRLTDVLSEDDR